MTERERTFYTNGVSPKWSEQEIAVAMCSRINGALKVLRALNIKAPVEKVCFHHYSNSVDKVR